MGSLPFFVIIVIVIFLFAFLSMRKKSIKERTWLGTSGMKAAYIWNHASSEQRDLMLAAIGVTSSTYQAGLLPKEWVNLPPPIQTSLAETLADIRKEGGT
jgi:hypothetical protein